MEGREVQQQPHAQRRHGEAGLLEGGWREGRAIREAAVREISAMLFLSHPRVIAPSRTRLLACAAASESAAAARAASGAACCAAGDSCGGCIGAAVDSRSTGSTNWRKTA